MHVSGLVGCFKGRGPEHTDGRTRKLEEDVTDVSLQKKDVDDVECFFGEVFQAGDVVACCSMWNGDESRCTPTNPLHCRL